MTHPALIERITRSLAYMLRHQPEEFDLELDAQGYGDSERIVQALNERLGEPVTMADLEDAIHSGDRPRYEIVGTRVRALYGHSIDVEPGEPSRPPEVLYVGISARDADRAMRYGLRGGRRRFLHLALTPDDAKEGGRRTGRDYVVITVYALDAWEEGINFYDRKALFLAEQIPIEFLEISETCHDGMDADPRGGGGGRREHGGDRHRGGGHRGPMRERAPEPRSEPRERGSEEEEGFGEGGSDAIQHQRERETRPVGAGSDFARRPDGRGENRGGRGPRGGRHPEGERGRHEDAHPMQGAMARAPQVGERAAGFGDEPHAGGGFPHGEREPRRDSGPARRDFERGGRPERPPEHGDRAPERGDRPVEHAGGGRGDRGDRGFDRGGRGDRGDRGDRGGDRGDRGDRGAAPVRAAPERQPAPPPQSPRPPEPRQAVENREPSPGFGLGIFEEPAAPKRPAAPAPRPVAPPPPPPPPARQRDDSDGGFGAGI